MFLWKYSFNMWTSTSKTLHSTANYSTIVDIQNTVIVTDATLCCMFVQCTDDGSHSPIQKNNVKIFLGAEFLFLYFVTTANMALGDWYLAVLWCCCRCTLFLAADLHHSLAALVEICWSPSDVILTHPVPFFFNHCNSRDKGHLC